MSPFRNKYRFKYYTYKCRAIFTALPSFRQFAWIWSTFIITKMAKCVPQFFLCRCSASILNSLYLKIHCHFHVLSSSRMLMASKCMYIFLLPWQIERVRKKVCHNSNNHDRANAMLPALRSGSKYALMRQRRPKTMIWMMMMMMMMSTIQLLTRVSHFIFNNMTITIIIILLYIRWSMTITIQSHNNNDDIPICMCVNELNLRKSSSDSKMCVCV